MKPKIPQVIWKSQFVYFVWRGRGEAKKKYTYMMFHLQEKENGEKDGIGRQ